MQSRSVFTRYVPLLLAAGALFLGSISTSLAQDASGVAKAAAEVATTAPVAEVAPAVFPQQTADIMWLLLAGFLVFFMQAGFAMVETGLTRAKNACNILMKNLLDFCFGAVLFWAIGYCLMYGANGNGFIGWDRALLFLGKASAAQDFKESASWFFQIVFAATAATIVSGAMAERTRLIAYIAYSIMISAILYPIIGHWIWGGGWLSQLGMRDFAGSTVVHSVGGWAALAGAILVGPRLGKYNTDGTANAIPGHSMPLAALGVFILWFGWYGFNPGSTLLAVDGIAHVAVTTTLGASGGAIAALIASWIKFTKPDLSMTLNGTLAGLVGVTAPCASVDTTGALIIGLVAGVLVFYSVLFVDTVLKIDDPVGAISVHAVCGTWGTIAVGLFGRTDVDVLYWSKDTAIKNGLFYGGGFEQLGIQLAGVGAAFVFAFGMAWVIFSVIKRTIGLRASDAEQLEGLDLGEHGNVAYGGFLFETSGPAAITYQTDPEADAPVPAGRGVA